MVIRKSRRRRRRSTDAPTWLVERLASGHDFAFLDGRQPEISREELAAAWERLRAAILADWIRERPGTRPWAWWEFDALEPRRQISGGPPRDGDGLWFGVPPCWGLEQFADPPVFETESEYLTRLKLLEKGERRREAKDAEKLERGVYAEILTRSDQVALERGCWFDHVAADRVERFFVRFLRHSHKPWLGQPFIPQPWQRDRILRPLYGWHWPSGFRRFRKAFVFVPKKAGKTTQAAAQLLYSLAADDPTAEVYNIATDAQQSGRIYAECERMLRKSPDLQAAVRVVPSARRMFCGDSMYFAFAGDSAAASEGINASYVCCDELHAWENPQMRKVWSSLYYADAARQQSLAITITTAGEDDPESLWIEEYTHAKQIQRGEIVDLDRLVFLAEAEEGDDWLDPEVWKKANPGWGVTIDPERFAREADDATTSDRKRRNFLRYRLNRPVGSLSSWLPEELWDACAARPVFPPGCTVCGGLDLSARGDFTALVFTRREAAEQAEGEELSGDEYPEDRYHVWPMLFLPEETIERHAREGRLLYRRWADEGWIHVVPGPVIREGFVIQQVLEVAGYCEIHELGFDPWNSLEEAMKLVNEHGVNMVELRQGFRTLSPPMKKLERLLLLGKLVHGGHPVLKWMFQNVQIVTDENGNIRPVKAAKHSPRKIDGIVALVMAIARAMLWVEERSVYETRGVISF
ncbi:MAG: terminase large subunit [Rhodospirillales bacterium]|jgi:phage terminase large subunit-like protein|nr:terminase large subunit [Rhodospirillales bacterium]